MHWGFARFALVTFVVGCSTPFLMPWLVAGLLNEEAAGAYGVCQTIVGVANMLILGVGNFISPLTARVMSQSGSEALWRTLIRANLFFLGILTAFLLLVVSSGTWLVSTLFGADYADLGIPMAILALSQIPAALGVVAGNGLWAIDQPRRNLPADWLTLIATVGSACLLIPQLNLLGAVLAILLGQSLGACCRWWMLIDVIGLPRSNNRPPPAAEISPESVLETK
jgi:O-antigen/teichoic acid export membrane protein